MFRKYSITLGLLMVLVTGALAKQMLQGTAMQEKELPMGKAYLLDRTPPSYTFTRTPVSLMTSYYDYMIGSYNSLPLQLIPDSAGGGYFLTYHGRRTPTGTRRVFYTHLNASGSIINNNEITSVTNNEGYPTIAVDPVSGKPLYAWHCNADVDAEFEVQFVSDAFMSGLSGLFNDPQIIMDGPITVTPGIGTPTTDNEFIWPSAKIGPSPIPGKRRIYVLARNSVYHTFGPSENVLIAYADFNATMLENAVPLVWSYTSIPDMDQWNHDGTWRRPFHALTTDEMGNVYYAGYHNATEADGTTVINEANFDVFKCPNYGQGTWSRISTFSDISTWNPPESPTSTIGYFKDEAGTPQYSLRFGITNSGHLNAITDNDGRIIVPANWGLTATSGTNFTAMQFVKAMIYDPAINSFSIKEIFPKKHAADTFNQCYTPWDEESPFGIVDEYGGDAGSGYFPLMTNAWPFPHWDDTLHTDAMMLHYNNIKVSEVNDQGMMVAIWQDSQRARLFNKFNEATYSAYANTPEIYISVSEDSGDNWSEPIILNNVDTPQFAGLKPMWVYPANKVKYVGMEGNLKVGKLGLMFYNDYTWGSNAITPAAHPTNDGGEVMFTELQIVFPDSTNPQTDPFGDPIVLSSSMAVMAAVLIDNELAAAGDVLAAYVDVNGVPQLRGKTPLQVNSNVAGCLLQVFTESNNENIYFKVWDASSNRVLWVTETVLSQINGSIGSWPEAPYWLNASISVQQSISFNAGWNMFSLNVHPADMSIASIFDSNLSNVQYIKSPQGIFQPNNPFNTLTDLADGNGYLVKITNPCGLSVTGSKISLSTPLALSSGWNLVAFTPQNTLTVETAIASITNQLIQIKGTEGIYEPGNPFSSLIQLSPGKSYWMMLSNSADLFYPFGGRISEPSSSAKQHSFSPTLKENSQSVLVKMASEARDGDILLAYVDSELRGVAELKNVEGTLGALIQVFTELDAEKIIFKLRDMENEAALELYPSLYSEPGSMVGDYRSGTYLILSADEGNSPDLTTSLLGAYPNPFAQGTNIALKVATDEDIMNIDIYNIKGQKVRTLLSSKLNPGSSNLWWDAKDDDGRELASGIYFCRLNIKNKNQSIKLMILK